MTVIDHPARHTLELDRRIQAEFADCPCWGATLVFDATLALEFGIQRRLIGSRGPVTIGEPRILLEDILWFVERNGAIILTSDQVDENGLQALDGFFVGYKLLRIEWGVYCSLIFSDGLVLRCDRTDAYETEGDPIVEFRFANGDFGDCFASGMVKIEKARP